MPKLPKQLTKELDLIQQLESQAAGRAIRIGLWLWQAKAALKHGEFKAWIEKHVQGRGYRSCAYYMKLTLTFAEKARVTEPILRAICALNFKKAPKSKEGREALEALKNFIGDLSLNELLIKHGIKGVGLKSELEGGDEPQQLTAAQQQQMELELVWSQSYEGAKSLAELLAEKAAALTPQQRDALEAELKKALQALRAA